MNRETFLESFGHIADAPGGIDKLRSLILDLAVRGQLGTQNDGDEPADALLARISEERARLVASRVVGRANSLGPVAETETFEVPRGWRWTRFGNLVSRVGAGSTPAGGAKSYVEDGVIFIRSQNVHNNGLILDGVAHIPRTVHERMSGTSVQGGDILLNITGASIGRSAIVPVEGWTTANVNQHVSVLRPLAPETTEYLHALIVSPYFQDLIAASSPGASREGLAIKRMEVFPIPLPPAAEQGRIVERVDDLLGLCDDLDQQQAARAELRSALTASTLNRVIESSSAANLRASARAFADNIDVHLAPGEGDLAALSRVRQGIIDLAVRGRLTHQDSEEGPASALLEVIAAARARDPEARPIRKSLNQSAVTTETPDYELPPGWTRSSVGELALSSESGWSPSCLPTVRTDDSQWAVLRVSAVTWGSFRSQEHKLLGQDLEPRPAIEVRDGDFLMSRANTSELVGRSVVVREPPPRLMLSDKLVRLKFADQVTAEYVNLVNASSATRAYYASVSSGTSASMRNITRGGGAGASRVHQRPIQVPMPHLSHLLGCSRSEGGLDRNQFGDLGGDRSGRPPSRPATSLLETPGFK